MLKDSLISKQVFLLTMTSLTLTFGSNGSSSPQFTQRPLRGEFEMHLDWSRGIIMALPRDQQLYQEVKAGCDSKIMAGP